MGAASSESRWVGDGGLAAGSTNHQPQAAREQPIAPQSWGPTCVLLVRVVLTVLHDAASPTLPTCHHCPQAPHLAGVVHDDGVAAAQEDLRGVLQAQRGGGNSIPIRLCMAGQATGSRPYAALALAWRSQLHITSSWCSQTRAWWHPQRHLHTPSTPLHTSSMARLESATYGTYLITTTWSGCSPGLEAVGDGGGGQGPGGRWRKRGGWAEWGRTGRRKMPRRSAGGHRVGPAVC